jgi:hypothetical protein
MSLISLPRRKLNIVQSTNDGEKMTYRAAHHEASGKGTLQAPTSPQQSPAMLLW